jgi:hypothetical protein
MNEYWSQWYETASAVNDMVVSSSTNNSPDGLISPAMGAGVVTLGVTTAGLGLIATRHPAAMAVGAALIAIPDPVVFSVTYAILS